MIIKWILQVRMVTCLVASTWTVRHASHGTKDAGLCQERISEISTKIPQRFSGVILCMGITGEKVFSCSD